MVVIQVSAPSAGTAIPNTVGFYVYSGYFTPSNLSGDPVTNPNSQLYGDLNSLVSIAGGGDDFTPISVDKLNSVTSTGAGVWAKWIYSTTLQGAINLWEGSWPTQGQTSSGSSSVVFNYSGNGGFTYEVIYN